MKRRIALLGPGRLGQAVARRLFLAGHDIVAVIGRDPARAAEAARFIGVPASAGTDPAACAAAEIILLALPDDRLEPAAAQLRATAGLAPGTVLVHFSGLHPAGILLGPATVDLGALAIHPLQTFADSAGGVRNLPGTPCAVEGPPHLLALAEQLATDFGGRPFRLAAEHKPLYHAAACVASNYLVTLVNAACELLGGCGYEREEACALLLPLLRGTLDNLDSLGPVAALTGPVVRGDARTVARHLEALADRPADLRKIYQTLGRKTVAVAREKGTLDAPGAEALLRQLKD